jgi:hypothetical protein
MSVIGDALIRYVVLRLNGGGTESALLYRIDKMRMRHTMGQDWGGRQKANPADCQKVTASDVLTEAQKHGYTIRRDSPRSWSMWWICFPYSDRITIGTTNFIALQSIKRIARTRPNCPIWPNCDCIMQGRKQYECRNRNTANW